MSMTEETQLGHDHGEMKDLLTTNKRLLEENNKLLKKIHRGNVIQLWTRIAWYCILIGLPFLLYFYVLEPYFTALGANYELFKAGISEIPGLKGLDLLLDSLTSGE